jgi:hypothetical protein
MTESIVRDGDIEILKLVHSHFEQDLREFWVRNNMFLVVTSVLVSVFSSTASRGGGYAWVLSIFGLIVSIFWFAVARASVRWINAWREEVCRLDSQIDRFQALCRVERTVTMHRFRSPSWLTQWFPMMVSVGWFLLAISHIWTVLV